MKHKVRVSKAQLQYFRALARESSKEIQAYLIGKVVSPELTIIEKFAYTKKYHTQSEGEVSWFYDEYLRVKQEAESKGYRIVGDIHSHPNWDAVLSPADYKGHIAEGNRICGICSTQDRKTRVRFWVPESALPCIIEYS